MPASRGRVPQGRSENRPACVKILSWARAMSSLVAGFPCAGQSELARTTETLGKRRDVERPCSSCANLHAGAKIRHNNRKELSVAWDGGSALCMQCEFRAEPPPCERACPAACAFGSSVLPAYRDRKAAAGLSGKTRLSGRRREQQTQGGWRHTRGRQERSTGDVEMGVRTGEPIAQADHFRDRELLVQSVQGLLHSGCSPSHALGAQRSFKKYSRGEHTWERL